MSAYSNPAYLATLAEFGEPVWLPGAALGVLKRSIPGTPWKDAVATYPLFSAQGKLDFETELGDCVSFVGVSDPLVHSDDHKLCRTFPDLCRPYKEHFVVELRTYSEPAPEQHRRNIRKAEKSLLLMRIDDPSAMLHEWSALYSALVDRHRIRGMATFSPNSFRQQLALPSLKAYGAWSDGELAAMTLWLQDGEHAYYHLGASTAAGYDQSASYGLFQLALQDMKRSGLRRVLLGAGAGAYGNVSDGLTRFKSGWTSKTCSAYLCGAIIRRREYKQVSASYSTDYFPAYRDPQKATATMTSPKAMATSR